MVVADPTNAAFDPTNNGFLLSAGVASLTVAVVATVAGSAGNVQVGAISILGAAMAGVDTVTNQTALTGGQDPETDAAFRSRFGSYLSSLSKATNVAVGTAVAGVQQGLSYQITENMSQSGAVQMGHFVVTVDDGSGHPLSSLLSTVWQAVDAIRPVGTSFAVQGPVVNSANISLTLTTVAGSSHANAVAAVASAIEGYVASLSIGSTLSYTRLAQLAYDAASAVTNVSSLLLNGGTADLVPGMFGVVRAGTVTVA
jgi:uncharacterized phage protein gp47/JayE